MEILEFLYEESIKNSSFIDRKVMIEQPKVILYGPRKSGKTHIVLDHLREYDKRSYLYIDLSDERFDRADIIDTLNTFIEKKPIQLLVIESYDFSFPLPSIKEIIVTTTSLPESLPKGFTVKRLFPLDFEEFIAFDKKHSNVEHLFNLYTNHGTFPHVVHNSDFEHAKMIQEMLHIMLPENTAYLIYKRYCELQGHKVSQFQIYNHLKSLIKLSKDKLYAITSQLVAQNLLFFVEKHEQPNASKKVYLIDFTFKNALSYKKDFIRQFENMIFLELIKRKKNIYYADGIDFYLTDESLAILCVGFATREMIEMKLQKLLPTFWQLHVKRIEVVTLSSESAQDIEGFSFTIVPFWEWALQL